MEGNKKNLPRAILIFGAPCSGKSTFAEQFSARFRAPFYDLSQIQSNLNLSEKELLYVVELITKSQVNLVLEGNLDSEISRTKIRNILRQAGYSPHLIWIQTDVLTIKSRLKNKLRSVKKAKEVYEKKLLTMEPPSDLEKPIVLSGKHTFKTQLSHVLAKLTQNDSK